ncbi:MAG: hypothetical protein QOJ51_1158 [Acidobacteriaceae bacterium]|jgi:hypothetical protein|nr:hypothetical protein [Acidobacteriaceae bacterium]MEA2258333.1 hypothetical protein [Acidobacteriaceae bacterium]
MSTRWTRFTAVVPSGFQAPLICPTLRHRPTQIMTGQINACLSSGGCFHTEFPGSLALLQILMNNIAVTKDGPFSSRPAQQ